MLHIINLMIKYTLDGLKITVIPYIYHNVQNLYPLCVYKKLARFL
jgi:hypothetical protein